MLGSERIRIFESQNILNCEKEPLSICSSDSYLFWVSFASGIIRGYTIQTNIDHKFNYLFEFLPVFQKVVSIFYLPFIKRIVTIEEEDEKRVCRIYHLFWNSKKQKTEINAFTLPLGGKVTLVSVCTISNSIFVCVDGILSVWKFVYLKKKISNKKNEFNIIKNNNDNILNEEQKNSKDEKNKNADLFEKNSNLNNFSDEQIGPIICILKIHTLWNIKNISIFKQFIAYSTNIDVRILKINFIGFFGENENEISKKDSNIDDENFKENKKISILEKNGILIMESFNEKFKRKKKLNKEENKENENIAIVYGSTYCENSEQNFIEVRFDSDTYELLPSSAIKEINFKNLKKSLKIRKNNLDQPYHVVGESPNVDHPIFINNFFIEKISHLIHKHIIKPEEIKGIHFIRIVSKKKQFIKQNPGMRCIITTNSRGYVYDVFGLKLLSQFDFFGNCIFSSVNSFFLFIITEAGLEIWSVLGTNRGCLMRFHPFISLKSISSTNEYIVLLSKFSSDENISLAAYFNKKTSKIAVISDLKHIDKFNDNSEKGSVLPLFSGKKMSNIKQISPSSSNQQKNVVISNTMSSVKSKSNETFSYNVYILSIVELSEIYEDMLEKTKEEEKKVDKQLILFKESHSLLQSKYYQLLSEEERLLDKEFLNEGNNEESNSIVERITLKIEIENYLKLLKHSFGLLGDAYCKVNDFEAAANSYAQSERPLLNVVKKFQAINLEKKDDSEYSKPLIIYLDQVLFDEEKSCLCKQNVEVGNRILMLYKKNSPQKLSQLILESNLICYDSYLAIDLIESITGEFLKKQISNKRIILKDKDMKIKRAKSSSIIEIRQKKIKNTKNPFNPSENNEHIGEIEEEKEKEEEENYEDEDFFWSEILPVDAFVLGLLYLEINNLKKAIKAFSSIEEHEMIKLCLKNINIFNKEISDFKKNNNSKKNENENEKEIEKEKEKKIEKENEMEIKNLNNSVDLKIEIKNKKVSLIQILRSFFPWCLLEILIELNIDIESSFYLLENSEFNLIKEEETIDSLMLKELYLSSIILLNKFKNEKEIKENIVVLFKLLLKDYFEINKKKIIENNIQNASQNNSQNNFFNDNFIIEKINNGLNEIKSFSTFIKFSFIKYRENWLNNIKNEEFEENNENEEIKNFDELKKNDLIFYLISKSKNLKKRKKFVLCFMEGILCYEEKKNLDFDFFLNKILIDVDKENEDKGIFILKILCLTFLNKKNEVFDLLINFDEDLEILFFYCLKYCDCSENWKNLLEKLIISVIKEENEFKNKNQIEKKDEKKYKKLFIKILWKLCEIFEPNEFLKIIPNNGNVEFFSVFLKNCFLVKNSKNIFDNLMNYEELQ